MSHWYDFAPVKKKLDKVKEVTGYRYEHKGESLRVFDDLGIVVNLTSLDKGMDFIRIVNSVLELQYARALEDVIQSSMSGLPSI
jgi:hypothetical protein